MSPIAEFMSWPQLPTPTHRKSKHLLAEVTPGDVSCELWASMPHVRLGRTQPTEALADPSEGRRLRNARGNAKGGGLSLECWMETRGALQNLSQRTLPRETSERNSTRHTRNAYVVSFAPTMALPITFRRLLRQPPLRHRRHDHRKGIAHNL